MGAGSGWIGRGFRPGRPPFVFGAGCDRRFAFLHLPAIARCPAHKHSAPAGLVGALLFSGQRLPQLRQHQPARLDAYRFGLEWRAVAGYFIRIHELATVQQTEQQGEGDSGFTRAIAAGQEVEGFHRSNKPI